MTRRAWWIALFLFSHEGFAQSLVADLDTTPSSELESKPSEFIDLGGSGLFSAEVQGVGRELFLSDGTEAGTQLVLDILPGPGSSNPRDLISLGSEVLFSADDGTNGRELWKSDGTTAGTVRVADIASGPTSSSPAGFVGFGSDVYFTVTSADSGSGEVWRTDGTTGGTALFADLNAGGPSLPSDWAAATSWLYFTADDGVHGREIWRTDGSTVAMVADTNVDPDALTAAQDRVFFRSNGAEPELWVTDGTGAGTLSLDLNPAGASDPAEMWAVGDRLYFIGDDGISGRQPATSDGTPAGTKNLVVVNGGPFALEPSLLAAHETSLGALLLVQVGASLKLYGSLGAPETTAHLTDLPVQLSGSSYPYHAVFGEKLVFAHFGGIRSWALDGSGIEVLSPAVVYDELRQVGSELWCQASLTNAFDVDREPWRTDGTAAGTGPILNLDPGAATLSSDPEKLTPLGSRVVFATTSGIPDDLWSSDGTEAGTALLAAGISAEHMTPFRGELFFNGHEGTVGRELFATDGAPGGTHLVKDIRPGALWSNPHSFTPWKGELYFVADDGVNGDELWVTDGTSAGTHIVRNIYGQGSAFTTGDVDFLSVGTHLLFPALNWPGGIELWRTDGTWLGTELVLDLDSEPFSSSEPALHLVVDGIGILSAEGPAGRDLWRTDGTAAGTFVLIDLPNEPSAPVAIDGDRFVFSHQNDLYVSDGTVMGTRLVRSFAAPALSDLTPFLGGVLFSEDGTSTVWTSDGTAPGTQALGGPAPDSGGYRVAGGHAYYTDSQSGSDDLYVIDGTAGAIAALGTFPSASPELAPGGGAEMLLRVSQPETGDELWLSDGTPAGTVPLSEIAHGPADSDPDQLVRAGDQVFFVAEDGVHGRELWSYPLADSGSWVAEPFGLGCGGPAAPEPRIGSAGVPAVGASFDLTLEDAAPLAPAGAVISGSRASIVLPGGCEVLLGLPWFSVGTGATDLEGELAVPVAVPADPSLAGVAIFGQFYVADASWPVAFGLSDGIELWLDS